MTPPSAPTAAAHSKASTAAEHSAGRSAWLPGPSLTPDGSMPLPAPEMTAPPTPGAILVLLGATSSPEVPPRLPEIGFGERCPDPGSA